MDRLLAVAEKMDQDHILTDFLHCLSGATEEAASAPAPKGGITGLWDMMKNRKPSKPSSSSCWSANISVPADSSTDHPLILPF